MADPVPTTVAGAKLVMRREMQTVYRDAQTLYMTVLFAIGFPILFAFTAVPRRAGEAVSFTLLMQMLLFPYIAGLQVSLSAFAAEKEQGTLGPLLATPLSNHAIFLGKLLSAWLPSAISSLVAFAAFRLVLAARDVDPLARFPARLIAELVLMAMVAGFAQIVGAILIGAKTKTLRGAQTLSSVVIFPVFFGVMFVAALFPTREWLALLILALLTAAAVTLLSLASRLWRREEALVAR